MLKLHVPPDAGIDAHVLPVTNHFELAVLVNARPDEATVPLLVTVTSVAALVLPLGTLPKLTLDGDAESEGAAGGHACPTLPKNMYSERSSKSEYVSPRLPRTLMADIVGMSMAKSIAPGLPIAAEIPFADTFDLWQVECEQLNGDWVGIILVYSTLPFAQLAAYAVPVQATTKGAIRTSNKVGMRFITKISGR